MKALSVRQPWAWLIIHAGKDVENRTWYTHYRGPLLIHASKGCTRAEYESALDFCDLLELPKPPPLKDLHRGGIVGAVVVEDCVIDSNSPWFVGRYGIIMHNAQPVEFYSCKGQLGLFEVELPCQ